MKPIETCTRCDEKIYYWCDIKYSCGNVVCPECKKETQAHDNIVYDNWVTSERRLFGGNEDEG